MLRNHQQNIQLLKGLLPIIQQQGLMQCKAILCHKSTNVFRQGKIMGKLFNHRVSGSKKRWFPSTTDNTVLYKGSQIGKSPNARSGGKNDTRRMTVLNKLFMQHITDILATGEISEKILGKGLQISRVKISRDFAYANVYWVLSGDLSKDDLLQHELQRCSGMLRHELSQLNLMGVVPRITFVKDTYFSNVHQVEALLKNMDFGLEEQDRQEEIDFLNQYKSDILKQEFYSSEINDIPVSEQQELNETRSPVNSYTNVPEMRHDVLGLDHKGIMLKILTKMRKSKQAWAQHLQNTSSSDLNNSNSIENSSSTIPSISHDQLVKIDEKLTEVAANSEKFESFLAERKERRNNHERRRFRSSNQYISETNEDLDEYAKLVLSKSQRELFEAEDYMPDEMEDKKHR